MSLYRLLSGLSADLSPYVISLSNRGTIGKRIQDLGVPVETLGMKSGMPSPLMIFRLVQKLKKLKPDLVHTWMYHADLIGGISARLAGVPAVTWGIRHSNLSPNRNKLSTLVVVKACSWLSRHIPDRILCCSKTARDIHVGVGYSAEKFSIIPNGIDISQYVPDAFSYKSVREELGLSVDSHLIGLISRFDSQKNHEGFIRAAGLLHARRPGVHFLLAGRGVDVENSELVGWIREQEVREVCHLLGQREDIPRLMSALDILTSNSWGEAFPNVVVEAMACCTPCVVTDVGDSAYIVGDTGKVVLPGDDAALVSAWETLLSLTNNVRIELGEKARERVAKNFELDEVVKQYQLFYEELIGLKIGKVHK